MSWELRAGVAADAKFLAGVDRAASGSPWSPQQFFAACENSGEPYAQHVLLAQSVDTVCGFAVYSQVLDQAEVLNIAVHPQQQGQGLGRVLLAAVLKQVKGEGAARCLLEVRESNTAARALYGSFQFELDGIRKNYYPTSSGRENALLMSVSLSEITATERAL